MVSNIINNFAGVNKNIHQALDNTVKSIDMITMNEIRLINTNQEKGKVFFHMVNGETIVRTMSASEICKANTIGNRQGEDARIAEYVRLFNEQYSEPKTVANVELSESDKRYFELQNMSKVFPLDAEQEEELKELTNQE